MYNFEIEANMNNKKKCVKKCHFNLCTWSKGGKDHSIFITLGKQIIFRSETFYLHSQLHDIVGSFSDRMDNGVYNPSNGRESAQLHT